jgi:dTDP-4-amino-4,6-dideoxygalactose transaminase
VNLPPGSLRTLISCILRKKVQDGPELGEFTRRMADWLGVAHVFGASSGRTAFQLALEALEIEQGREIIFPVFTFPVMPLVAKMLGYKPVFCDVDPRTYNAGPKEVEPLLNENTGAVLATHLFGRPCDIRGIAQLIRGRDIRLLEDCAHACGVRVDGQQAGTFGDVGIFSFAEGKNMPCCGGGVIATADELIAERTRAILAKTEQAPAEAITRKAVSIWIKWLLTRPLVFGLTGYPALRLKLASGKPLMDSSVGNTLLAGFAASNPRITPLANLSAAVGLLQLRHIDAFNEGARRNAAILTERIGEVPGVRAPDSAGGTNIYVYYPLSVDAGNRDELRHRLLRNGIDTKISDMSDCSVLDVFRDDDGSGKSAPPREASIIEICVYPVVPQSRMHKIAKTIRAWASLPEL